VDPFGRLWIGTVDLDHFKPVGSLYLVYGDGRFESKLDGIKCSNGLGWTANGKKMFYTDSRLKLIWSFDFEPENGALSNRKVFTTIEDEGVSPDGLSVDVDGCVWSALFGGSAIIRFDPLGKEIERVRVPATRPTSCAFGGPDRKTLFVTSESFQLPVKALLKAPNGGGLFAVETDSVGVEVNKFRRVC
jgi:sugar lactone lactonase YvrE